MVTVPRPVIGSVGDRIRLIFGHTGDDWLLLLNHDNGDTKWQVKDWKGNIPDAVGKQINNCTAKGRDIKHVDFGLDGAWFVEGEKPDGTGNHSWWGGTMVGNDIEPGHKVSFGTNAHDCETHTLIDGRNSYQLSNNINNSLGQRIKRLNNKNKAIEYIRLFHDNYYFISDDEGENWSLPEYPRDEVSLPGNVKEVALAKDGSWLVIRDNKYVASNGVDKDLTRKLSKFISDQRGWETTRRREIQSAHDRNRLEREALVEATEQLERLAEERRERLRLEQEQERDAFLAAQREDRERAQRETREADLASQERVERDAATRISSLEAKLERRYLDEASESLQRRKQALLDEMPANVRSRSVLSNDQETATNSTCVVCLERQANFAVVPCGHVCLCSTCSDICTGDDRPCPLCRVDIQSTLRIYLGR